MPIVVTRPAEEAARWVQQLQARGLPAVALPLLAIGPAPDPAALAEVARHADRWQAVMFVSVNAAAAFCGVRAPLPWPAGVRAWAPGPGTRQALRQAGVPEPAIDAPAAQAEQFDSESLWTQVQGQVPAGGRVLIVRGSDALGRSQGREWLAQQLAARGVGVDVVAAYSRQAPVWTAGQLAQARSAAADRGSWWLFSSSEAVTHLGQLLPGQDWSGARAIATHPRIAQTARALGFGVVRAARPGVDEVIASIESAG